MPAIITSDEYGLFPVIGDRLELPLNTPAWDCVSYLPHYDGPPVVGEDRPVSGNAGRLSLPDEIDEDEISLRMVFYGDFDYEGNAYSSGVDGIRQNLLVFRSNIVLPIPRAVAARGSRPYELHTHHGDLYTGEVKVRSPLALGEMGPAGARGVLKMKVPAGLLDLAP